jgi:para-nitrobenzyl esterase
LRSRKRSIDRRSFTRLVGASLGAGALGALPLRELFAQEATATPGPVVATKHGRVRGTLSNGVHAFKGIRYGASTAGSARFHPPKPPTPWTDVREASGYGPRAPQPVRLMIPELGDALIGSGPLSED